MNQLTETVDLVTLSAHDYLAELSRDVTEGLRTTPKHIPSKYFYDPRGGELFERITALPEYYLTRTEMSLLAQHAADIMTFAGPTELLEIGSGSADKTSLLLEACGDHRVSAYAGLDVNGNALVEAGHALLARHPEIGVTGLIGDFINDLGKVPPGDGRRLIQFFGSTIGNLVPPQRESFLRDIVALMGEEDTFLLGIDLAKDPRIIQAAYDDAEGLTAEFTRNVLRVINRELDADFVVDAFEHVPRWNAEALRMEAWLRAPRDMAVTLRAIDLEIIIEGREEIHTEVSCKFTPNMIEEEFAAAGLSVARWYTAPGAGFALALGILA